MGWFRRFALALGAIAAVCVGADAQAATPQQIAVLFGRVDPYPGASVALDFVGAANGQPFYKASGAISPTFSGLPGLTVSRASVAYGSCNGALTGPFPANTAVIDPCGLAVFQASTNFFLNSLTPATQTITIGATGSWTTSLWGTGSVTTSAGTATCSSYGTASAGKPNTISCTVAGTVTLTVSGSLSCVNFENLGFGTTCIPTTASSATRPTDVVTLNVAAPGAGTIVAQETGLGNGRGILSWNDGTTNNQIDLRLSVGGGTASSTGGVANWVIGGGPPVTGQHTSAVAYSASSVGYSVDGGVVSHATPATGIAAVSSLQLGGYAANTLNQLDGYLRQVRVYPYAANDNELTYRSAGNF